MRQSLMTFAALSAPCLVATLMSTNAVSQQRQPAEGGASANMNRPGMTWQSLAVLPDLLNAQWIPEAAQDEKTLLKSIVYPPLMPEFIGDAKTKIASILKGQESLPTADCRVEGQPRLAWYPHPLQFMYGAGNVMIQVGYQVRQISAAGINHPADLSDPNALVGFSVNGDAKGMWEGDTLVVDTIAVRDDVDTFYGVPNDPAVHIIERYRLTDHNTLERQTVIEAPNTFTKPWAVNTKYKRAPAASLASTFCEPKGGWFADK